MRFIRRAYRRLAELFRRSHRDADFSAELDAHLHSHIGDNLRAGMRPDEARRAALLALGGVVQTTEARRTGCSAVAVHHGWRIQHERRRDDEGRPDHPEMYLEPVSARYFDTLGIRLLAGRAFNANDTAGHPNVMIINETAAKRFWPGVSAIGKRVGRPGATPNSNPNWSEVVGVVNDVRFPANLGTPYSDLQGFRPVAQVPMQFFAITLRTSIAPESLADPLKRTVAGIDSSQLVSNIRTERSVVDQGLGNVSLLATLLGAFASLGLALAAIGIYSVTAYAVAQRTNELGIRVALGAQAHDILRLVMAQGSRVIAAGSLIGVAGGYVIARLLASAIPTLPTRDPVTVLAITLALVGSALAACYLPARRATKINPLLALRHD